ncbi:MAG: 4Fe-4S binding protein [Calditrichia bacterium]
MKMIGLILFFTGLAVFTGSLFIGNYQITDNVLVRLSDKIPPERLQKLLPLKGKIYTSKFAALSDIETYINDDGRVEPYQMTEYKTALLREANSGILKENPFIFFLLSIGLASAGGLIYALSGLKTLPGIKNDGVFFSPVMNRGLIGILTGAYLIGFYIVLYWYPEFLVNLMILVDPISQFLRNLPANRWFLYGTLYTFAVTVMGVRMYVKYRHNRYQLLRTTSVIFFQFGFAFLIPALLERLNKPSMDLKNAWPLNYSFFMDWNLSNLLSSGSFGLFLLFWGIILSLIIVPLFTYLFGKRWYCSWVCGCGGLAETLGDPFRQLSSKTVKAWRIERILIHSVLIFAVVMTIMQISNFVSHGSLFGNYTWRVNQAYGFLIGSIFAGVVGTGFYPLMGNRVWCRFGCPLAAIMGIVQKFKSRFVITTNGAQCISCGNCSTYCEMGIDVRWYAQRGQNIIRASCVGCGICAAVCPRGVLKLETTEPGKRYNQPLNEIA